MDIKIIMNVTQFLVSVMLIVVVTVQSRGAGFGGAFGTQGAVFRTRRGVEQVLFRATIGLAVIFIAVSIVSVRVIG
ncbi:MAG: preprotein translocase subunit SecG [Dehalococcoidia bacterium]|nr:preprotein translocase subunit SecG [Dehalococcoidia bacterium]